MDHGGGIMITGEYINKIHSLIQESRPVVHCITNIVTVNDCANVLLAVGASPTMAHHPMEVEEITSGSSALVCNMGAVSDIDAMLIAGRTAHRLGHPVVLDPVGVSGSGFRRGRCLSLIHEIVPTCIRGNYSEIRALMEQRSTAAGVDSGDDGIDITAMKQFAESCKAIVIASGAVDIITDGRTACTCKNGSPEMARITGSGCMSSAMLGAFLYAEPSVKAAAACCVYMGIAGERAAKKTEAVGGGTMTFREYFIDEISLMGPDSYENIFLSYE